MRKFLLLLLIASLPAEAKWTLLGDSQDGNVSHYFDNSSFKYNGSKVKVWELVDMKVPLSINGKFYTSTKNQYEYDCKEDTSRLLVTVGYADAMGMGAVVFSYNYTIQDEQANPVVPDSVGSYALKNACKNRKMR